MNFTRFSIFLVTLALIGTAVSLVMDVSRSEAAFGTSPPWVRNDHLLPGTTFEQVINLSRSNPNQDMKVNVRISGDKNIEKWLKIEDMEDLIMKKGEKILPMKVTVKIPKRAAIRDYKGGIFVTLEPIASEDGQKGGNVSIRLGAHISVNLSVVGEKITDYRVKSISLTALNEGELFYINVEVENLGNTEIDSLNGQIDIYNSKETEVLKTLTFGSLSDAISPDDMIRSQVVFEDFILDPGEYWIVVKVFKDNEVIYENRLHQEVKAKVVPVITPEDAEAKRPSLPAKGAEDKEFAALSPEELELATEEELRGAALPLKENKLFLIFGLVGFGFGLIALLSVIILLVIILKRQHQATIQRYLTQSHDRHQ